MTGLELFGVVCAVAALIAFVGNQYNFLPSDGIPYDLLNCLSALGLLYYAYETNAVPFIITNSVWALVSGIDVIKDLLKRSGPQP